MCGRFCRPGRYPFLFVFLFRSMDVRWSSIRSPDRFIYLISRSTDANSHILHVAVLCVSLSVHVVWGALVCMPCLECVNSHTYSSYISPYVPVTAHTLSLSFSLYIYLIVHQRRETDTYTDPIRYARRHSTYTNTVQLYTLTL